MNEDKRGPVIIWNADILEGYLRVELLKEDGSECEGGEDKSRSPKYLQQVSLPHRQPSENFAAMAMLPVSEEESKSNLKH